jgi:alkylation response protein AidB-like acyl-CoA dehydrogenase
MSFPSMTDGLVERVAAQIPWMRRNAAALDEAASFPTGDMIALGKAGAFCVPLPMDGGDPDAATDLLVSLLILLGSGNLSVGRLFEAHVNALQLIGRYGTSAQRTAAREAAARGELHALWVTDATAGGVRMIPTVDEFKLSGAKMFCSGAGHVAHAVIVASTATGEQQMLILPMGRGERATLLPGQMQGMRSAVTCTVDFTDVSRARETILGHPGDYMREPDFSCGAWRGSAVALGGLCALLDAAIAELNARHRIDEPNQLARLGHTMIARETSRLWVHNAARIAEDNRAEPEKAVAYVGLARIAVESACLDAMRLVQRSLGLSAFRNGHAAERICRDLGTYLRQLAPDEVLSEAASWFVHHPSRDAS